MAICSKCNAVISDAAVFCPNCGANCAPAEAAPAQPAFKAQPSYQPAPQPAPQPVPQPIPSVTPQPVPQPMPQPVQPLQPGFQPASPEYLRADTASKASTSVHLSVAAVVLMFLQFHIIPIILAAIGISKANSCDLMSFPEFAPIANGSKIRSIIVIVLIVLRILILIAIAIFFSYLFEEVFDMLESMLYMIF